MSAKAIAVLILVFVSIAILGYLAMNKKGDVDPQPNRERIPEKTEVKEAEFKPAHLLPLDPKKIEPATEYRGEVVRDQVLVTLHRNRTKEDLETILKLIAPNAKIVGDIPMVWMFQVEVDSKMKEAIKQKLDNHPWIVSASLNYIQRPKKDYNDPFLGDAIKGWGVQRINAPLAWDISTGEKTTIAIVDSGTLVTHEEFTGKVVTPYSYATGSETIQHKEYFIEGRGGVFRLDYAAGHGTHVAGTASGKAGNSKGTAGIAPDARVMPIQVLYYMQDGNKERTEPGIGTREVGFVGGSTADIVAGITRAIGNKADVINLSLGGVLNPAQIRAYIAGDQATKLKIEKEYFIPYREEYIKPYLAVLDLAKKNNVILVNAAGNDNIPAKFGGFSYSGRMISVAATTKDDERSGFSNYGTRTDVSAPGSIIHSSFSKSGNAYTALNGTSMACPHVAGLVALMRSIKPDLTFEEAREILIQTGTKLTTDQPIGPLVNASGAVKETKRRVSEGQKPPEDKPPLIPDPTTPPVPNPKPPVGNPPPVAPVVPKPTPKPTPEQIVNGPNPWENREVQNLIDLWLSIATPPLKPIDGFPWFYDKWGRHLNNHNVWANYEPDHSGTRHQYVWQLAKKLKSTRHGTLYEFVLGMLRDGKFNPAPIEIPGQPNPPTQPKPGSNSANYTIDKLRGEWRGKNANGDSMGLTIFDDKLAWLIRDGNPIAGKPNFNVSKTPVVLELLSDDGKVTHVASLETLGKDEIKVATYFSKSQPKFRPNDKRYTYLLRRVKATPENKNPARHGYKLASVQLRSVETVIVGSPDKNRVPGIGFVMKPGYKVTQLAMGGDGKIGWIVIDNRYPVKGTVRAPQIWSVNMATGHAQQSGVDLSKSSINAIRTTPDGKFCWAILDYSLPAAVQPIREFRIMRATAGKRFQLIADTGKEKKIERLGLAQSYEAHALPGGNEIIFNDRSQIWRASQGGFTKIVERKQVETGSLKLVGNNGFRQLRVSRNGRKWVATMLLGENKKSVNTILYGDTSGSVTIAKRSSNYLYVPQISSDGLTISYFDGTERETYVGSPGNFRKLKRPGRYNAYSPVFHDQGKSIYGVIGFYGTGNIVNGFMEELSSGNRLITHGGLMLSPSPKNMSVSSDGRVLSAILNSVELATIHLGKTLPANAPRIEEVLSKIEKGKLHVRVRLANPEDVYRISIVALHENYVPAGSALSYADQPYSSWASMSSIYKNKQYSSYRDASTKITEDGLKNLPNTRFMISIRNKNYSYTTNYLIKFASP